MNSPQVNDERRELAAAEHDEQLARILDEYLADLEGGLPPDLDGLVREHPHLADELRSFAESLQTVHEATRSFRAAKGAESVRQDVPRAKRIGEFRLIREIGRGGMGIVYEAQQESLNRRVALKILPFAAVLDQRQIARFRNEAQAAAQLNHPNIVPVFAVGHERGVYFYAMQFIDGQSLEEVIRQQRGNGEADRCQPNSSATSAAGNASTVALRQSDISTLGGATEGQRCRNIARLGMQAAEALGHAHEVGIVHRDVKPSNLMLDHHGKLWITDFGLARMQSDASVTISGDLVGTLRYMSPEQATGKPQLVDSRTDVYSLGATLYELLTLRPAIAGDDRQELLRSLEQERVVPLRQLNPSVPVDLETIVQHAMAASPHERYATAQELADDLNRFLRGESPHARRRTVVDQLAKWTRRHRSLVSIAAASVVIMCALSIVGMVLLARESSRKEAALNQAQANARQAEQHLQRANEHYRLARDVVDRFGIRTADRLTDTPGTEVVREGLIAETLGYYEEFVARAQDDPQLRDELATAHYKSGVLAARLGRPEKAIAAYGHANKLLDELTGERAGDVDIRLLQLLTHNNLALLLVDQNQFDAARGEYDRALQLGAELSELAPGQAEVVNQVTEVQANHAMLLFRLNKRSDAVENLTAATRRLEPLVENPLADPRLVRNLGICYNNLSHIQREADADLAEHSSRKAVGVLQRLVHEYPESDVYRSDLALCYNNLATILSGKEQLGEAIECYRNAASQQLQLARKSPSVVRHRSELGITLNNLGVAFCRENLPDPADESFGQAQQVFQTLVDDYPNQLQYRSGLAALLNNQGLALVKSGRAGDALAAYGAAVDAQHEALELSGGAESLRLLLSKIYFNQARALAVSGSFNEAAQVAQTRAALWTGNGQRLFSVVVEMADLLNQLRRSGANDGERPRRDQLADSAIDTLRQAIEAGFQPAQELHDDDRLASLREHPDFEAVTKAHDTKHGALQSARLP